MSDNKRKILTLALAALAMTLYWIFPDSFSFLVKPDSHAAHLAFTTTKEELKRGNKQIESAAKTHTSHIHIKGVGSVLEILDEKELGDAKIQRFLVELPSGHKLTVTHKTGPGHPPIRLLVPGAEVEFSGTYIWNAAGGEITNTAFNENAPEKSGWIKANDILHQ